ncbi:thiol-activated cytolysin family protein [Porphyromonas levii]|uniref:thiol-activated cytolysin family protein n=1 Tax=Porphyromonas levii TaxID=28114 RepID=UPI001BAA8F3C|nr:thiol-activated cytolysin family protein [Porphyromonas levii]MBR8807059.1 hypothetical protein [Porphyromonas levii]
MMTSKTTFLKSLTLAGYSIVAALVFASCSPQTKDAPNGNEVLTNNKSITAYLTGLPVHNGVTSLRAADFPENGRPVEIGFLPDGVLRAARSAADREPGVNEKGQPGWWVKTSRRYKLSEVFDESVLLNPTNDVLFPGVVFRGNTIGDGTYAVISDIDRAKIKISIDRRTQEGDNDKISREFENIQMSDYRKALNEWGQINFKEGSALTTSSIDEVRSMDEVNFKMGAGFDNGAIKVSTNLKFNFENNKNHFLVKFIQKQYSVTMDIPKMIFKTVDPKVIKDYQPVYISNIDYGRMVFMSVETSHSLQEVEAALKAAVEKLHINGELEAKYRKVLDSSTINFVAIGGGVDDHSIIVEKGWEGCKNFMISKIPLGKLPPIAFQLRLASDNSVARVVKATEYTITKREFIPDCRGVDILSEVVSLQGFSYYGGTIWVYGHCGLEAHNSALKVEQKYIFDRSRDNYQSILNDIYFPYPVDSPQRAHITISKPENMDMEEFLRQRVNFTTNLSMRFSSPSKDVHLAKGTIEFTIADIIKMTSVDRVKPKPMIFCVSSSNNGYKLFVNFKVHCVDLLPVKADK